LSLHSGDALFTATDYEKVVRVDGTAAKPASLLPLALAGASSPERVTPGATVPLSLTWRLLDRPERDYSISAKLLDADGRAIAQDDRPLGGGRDLLRTWYPGFTITTTHRLVLPPESLGRYRLEVFLYRPDGEGGYLFFDRDGVPASDLTRPVVVKPASMPHTALPVTTQVARFGRALHLLQTEAVPPASPGQTFTVTTTWTAGQSPSEDYTLFAHLVSPGGDIRAQQDQPFWAGRYPTGIWEPGELVTETVHIAIPAGLTGQSVCLRLGLYDPLTMQRLQRSDEGGDFWQANQCWKLP
jgi:hypothetical protein